MSVVQIKSISGAVLFEQDVPDDVTQRTREALVAACNGGADLSGAYLRGADLSGAYLSGANLGGADLRGAFLGGADLRSADLRVADLSGAFLRGADLRGAFLGGADLRGADLSGAFLRGAFLGGAKLSDEDVASSVDCVVQLGPIGSRDDYMLVWQTNNGLRVVAGCFYGTDVAFLDAVVKTHGDNKHAVDYRAAIEFARIKLIHTVADAQSDVEQASLRG